MDKLCDQAEEQNTPVTCFYFDFAARKEQSVTSMLGSLLKQIVGGLEKIPDEISKAFQGQGMAIGGRGPLLPDIVKMLQLVTSSLRTFVCIDALDECAAVHRVKLLDSLKQILEKSPHTRIFIIGRPHVRTEVEKRLAGRVICLPVGPSKDDIIGYLRVRLEEDETPEAMDESLEAEILSKIPEKMSEMYVGRWHTEPRSKLSANKYASRFLLVSLSVDTILHESTIYGRQEKLSGVTDGSELGDVYGATIERIKAQPGDRSRLGMAALMWISHAERPLQADELCHALAVKLGSTDFNARNVPLISTLVSCCQGLITVDKEASTVRLIHFTLQDYLSAHADVFSRPHAAMAEICSTYLNSRQIRAISNAHFEDERRTSFLEYCSIYWGVHAKRESSDSTRSLAVELLNENYGSVPTRLLLKQVSGLYISPFGNCSPFSGLHCASFFGIFEVVATFIKMERYDINEGDFLGYTPLAWASRNGHEEVVKILLGQEEVNPDKPDDDNRAPLSYAAESGYEGVVKLLLEREEVNPDKLSSYGQTPLSFAAHGGYEGVVKLLLEREQVNPDKPDDDNRAPLSYAAEDGHEGVVKLLLEREEVNPDKSDVGNRTPLSYAAKGGYEGVVKLLLDQEEVNPDKPDRIGRKPLLYAAKHGHEGVVKLLLEREEDNTDVTDNIGQTPLSLATMYGHNRVAALLQSHKAVTPQHDLRPHKKRCLSPS